MTAFVATAAAVFVGVLVYMKASKKWPSLRGSA
jgi:hypothetical protein